MIFDNIEKDILYSAIIECGVDYAKNNGKDERAEDVILYNDLIENVSRFDLVEKIIKKLNDNGYTIEKE